MIAIFHQEGVKLGFPPLEVHSFCKDRSASHVKLGAGTPSHHAHLTLLQGCKLASTKILRAAFLMQRYLLAVVRPLRLQYPETVRQDN